MRQRLLYAATALAMAVAFVKLGSGVVMGQAGQSAQPAAAAKAAPSMQTPWGEPDLQGIWALVYQVPLQRPPQYAGREFFTDAEIAELDKERATLGRRDARTGTPSEDDVAGAYNAVFNNFYH